MSDTPESSRQRFEDWCKESDLAEDRQAFSVWSARDAEVETLKAEVAAKDGWINELDDRVETTMRTVANRDARIAELEAVVADQGGLISRVMNDALNHGTGVMRVSVDNDGNLRTERINPADMRKESSDD